jgi:hypothetical protein
MTVEGATMRNCCSSAAASARGVAAVLGPNLFLGREIRITIVADSISARLAQSVRRAARARVARTIEHEES